jgi:hypothetical protein
MSCVALLLAQLAAIAYSRSGTARYFCWAPFDTLSRYEISVTLPGRGALPEEEIQRRYRIAPRGSDNRSPQHVIDILRQYEETYGKSDGAEIRMSYAVNGGPTQEWRWPPR